MRKHANPLRGGPEKTMRTTRCLVQITIKKADTDTTKEKPRRIDVKLDAGGALVAMVVLHGRKGLCFQYGEDKDHGEEEQVQLGVEGQHLLYGDTRVGLVRGVQPKDQSPGHRHGLSPAQSLLRQDVGVQVSISNH